MRPITHLFSIFAALSLTVAVASGDALTVSDVLTSPSKYHGKTVQIRGVFWTDGEGSVLLQAATDELRLDNAIAVAGNWKELVKDENYQRLKADRLLLIKQTKEKNPNARWVVFQAAVVFEGRFEDAESLPFKKNSDGEEYPLLNPYRGCRWKLDLSRVVSYSAKETEANQSADSTTSAGSSAAGQPRVPASAASHL